MFSLICLALLAVCISPSNSDKIVPDSTFLVAISYEPVDAKRLVYRCAGALVTSKHVVTAAQCVVGLGNYHNVRVSFVKKDITLYFGNEPEPTNIVVDSISVHPKYKIDAFIHDIAVIHLKVPIFYSDKINPIKLLSGAEYLPFNFYKGKIGTVLNWKGSNVVELSLKSVENSRCADAYDASTSKLLKVNVTNNAVLCAGENFGVCEGGAGAPIVYYHPKYSEFRLAGIASSIYECGKYPNIFMKMAYYVNFLEEITGEKLG